MFWKIFFAALAKRLAAVVVVVLLVEFSLLDKSHLPSLLIDIVI